MEYYDLGSLVPARFIKRLNRFAALVELDGQMLEVHVANSGRMGELLLEGVPVWLKKADNPNRKTAYDLLLCEYRGQKVCLNAHLANDFLAHWLANGCLTELAAYPAWQREYKWQNSRFDFFLHNEREKMLLEVKSVNYLVGKTAVFPDAPTARGSRHLEELAAWQRNGQGPSAVCFVVMGQEAEFFQTNEQTDPLFAATLAKVRQEGVQVLVYKSRIEDNKVFFGGRVAY